MTLNSTYRTRAAGLLVALGSFVPHFAMAQRPSGAERFVGNWTGTLSLPAARLRLALAVARDAGAGLTGEMVSLDQGNAKIPAQLTIRGDTLVVTMPMIQGSYTAVITTMSDTLRGTFTQGAAMPLDMTRGAALPVIKRPQEPVAPFPYQARDVSIESVAGVRLAGTLLLPAGNGPFPAVVLVTGSGPQDRNEELVGHKPFLVIADYLARHGIASLRYDDRGTAQSTGNFAAGTSADFANDAESAVRFLRRQPGIAPGRVGIMGHSEGGMIAPLVAARSKDVAFIVLLAGPGIPGDSLLLLQSALISTAGGMPPAMVKRISDINRQLYDAIKAARDSADAAERVAEVYRPILASQPADEQALGSSQLAAATTQLMTPWMRFFIPYDPQPALRRIRVPVLAIGGSLDLQVPPNENLSAIGAALKSAGNTDYRTVILPGLNHLFQAATTGMPTEYATISETFSPVALDIIGVWINERFGKQKK